LRGGIHVTASTSSPLRARTGKAASHASISSDRHIDLPPTTRDGGNVPARIHDQSSEMSRW
jgi:hypothetical protein